MPGPAAPIDHPPDIDREETTVLFAQSAEDLAEAFDIGGLDMWDWIGAGITLVVAMVVAFVIRRLVHAWISRIEGEGHIARLLSRFAEYLLILVGLVVALDRIGVDVFPLLGALGVAGIALAFALQNILENFIAGILILLRRPIRIGDQAAIGSGPDVGTVIDINLRTTVLEMVDGKQVYVPNASVLNNPIENYTTKGKRRTDVPVGVAYATDLERARSAILEAVRGVEGVLGDPAPLALVHAFGSSSIDFVVRYWHLPTIAVEWEVRDAVAVAVKASFDRSDVEIPFPQRVVWFPETLRTEAPAVSGA
ncbi:MAG: mechanosensitive ion channel family protein [Acidimicrobiia bacterium]|nr:mechanosensitive ion channel family protein [Acidimicrobiia bacterium]